VEKRWFVITTGSGQGPEAQRLYGTYVEAKKEAEKMWREFRTYVQVRPE
jgi:hypothetical protein